jgi:hypothetical protein
MPHTSSRIAGAVIAALTLTLMQPVLAQGAVPAQVATAASARAKPVEKVQARISQGKILAGQDVRITGSVKPGRARDVVKVQRNDRGVWRTVKFGKLTPSRTYLFTVRPKAGKNSYRVVRPETSTGRRGTSKTVSVTAETCTAMPRPRRTMLAFATNPTENKTAQMTRELSHLFCAVAPKATVRVAMLFVKSDRESKAILESLRKVHRYRGVHVEVLAEGHPYEKSVLGELRKTLGSFATVRTCTKGCRSGLADANMHDKFVTVSDMTWGAGADPLLWSSSANWDRRQLRDYWQTGILVYGNRRLNLEYNVRFESMRACGLPGGCGQWRPSVFGHALDAGYRLIRHNSTWTDAGFGWRAGDARSGTRTMFSPVQPGTGDPVVNELARYRCTPAHHTVRLGVFGISTYRGPVLARALGQLRQRGCDVRAVLSVSKPTVTRAKGVAAFKAQGVSTTCAVLMHDKFVYLDVVDRVSGQTRHVLSTGSQNFTGAGAYINDDTMLTMEAETASGQRAADIRYLGAWYLSRWGQLFRHSRSCR